MIVRVLVSLLLCGLVSKPAAAGIGEFLPLQIGNYWVYETLSGNLSFDQVIDTETIEGETYFLIDRGPVPAGRGVVGRYRVDGDGRVWQYDEDLGGALLFLDTTLPAGSVYPYIGGTARVDATDFVVATIAGNFGGCSRFTFNLFPHTFEDDFTVTICRGVGIVEVDGYMYRRQLVSFGQLPVPTERRSWGEVKARYGEPLR